MIDPDATFKTLSLLAALRFSEFHLEMEWPIFILAVLIGYSIITALTQSPYIFGRCGSRLEIRAKRLEDDELRWTDYAFVTINKLVTVWYVVYGASTIRSASWVKHDVPTTTSPLTVLQNLSVVLLSLGCYDLIYVPFHRMLHLKWLYPWIHKHHHRQAVPFRGTFDGINTHPFEFWFGEFLHVWSLQLVGWLLSFAGLKVPLWGCFSFLLTGGLMASLNHTRFGISIPFVYDVRSHDVHHRKPQSNYCQFVPWFDMVYGTFELYKTATEARQERQQARDDVLAGKETNTLLNKRSLFFDVAGEKEISSSSKKIK